MGCDTGQSGCAAFSLVRSDKKESLPFIFSASDKSAEIIKIERMVMTARFKVVLWVCLVLPGWVYTCGSMYGCGKVS
jgi:hypothetical protein